MKIAVLGSGMVGRAIAYDLARNFTVQIFDINSANLELAKSLIPGIQTHIFDFQDYSKYNKLMHPFDLVVTAVPGFLGYKTVESVIKANKNIVDISFFPENVLALDELAKERKVTVITDCGVAPGMSNLILGRYNEEMEITDFEFYVGGLPTNPVPPFYYKAPFSPIDVIQEYIRPARMQENGFIVTKDALTDREIINFDGVGKLEAFNTDGLRTLLYTMSHIPNMKEKTLRHPGHLDAILFLKNAGFLDEKTFELQEIKISPLSFTSKILVDKWALDHNEDEFTIMKVIMKNDKSTIEYNLFDKFDPISGISSMARTTGYTCTAAVHLVAKGLFSKIGIYPPELIGRDKFCFDFIIDYLRQRNVIWTKV